MAVPAPTPEQIVLSMTIAELQEFLGALSLESSRASAERLRRLVCEAGSLDEALTVISAQSSPQRLTLDDGLSDGTSRDQQAVNLSEGNAAA